ncbi:MAG: hypothetical protein ACRDP9_03055, partial [Kribbellaceae bacterium]
MESLDDVIDAMIADRVIHRHRRKWLVFFLIILALVALIFFLGGWKQKKGRVVDTLPAPLTIEAGRYEFGVTAAKIIRTPKTDTREAEARLEVSMDIRNIDEETKATQSVSGGLLVFLPGGGKQIESNGATCRDELNYNLVYGLPAVPCFAKFEVPADLEATEVEIGILGEQFVPDDSIIGTEEPYWQRPTPVVVVRVPT